MPDWKLVGCLRRPSGPAPTDGIGALIPDGVDFQRIVVSEAIHDEETSALVASRGASEPHGAVLEAWTSGPAPAPVHLSSPLLDGSLFWTREHVFVEEDPAPDPATHRKVVFPLRRRPGMPQDDFYRYWREEHGPLVASVARDLGIRRYVQSHTDHERQVGSPFDGLAEVWVSEPTGPFDEEARRRAGRLLVEDEARFIDLARSTLYWTRERVVR
jgi:EthD domain